MSKYSDELIANNKTIWQVLKKTDVIVAKKINFKNSKT